MYNGNNKTALTSQKQISEALLQLLQVKSFSEVSVCEICKEAQISRQTFYSLFQSKENVISYELERNYCFTVEHTCCSSEFTLDGLCEAYASYIEEQKDFIRLLVDNQIMNCMYESIYRALLDCSHFMPNLDSLERVYLSDFVAEGLTSIAKNYVLYDPVHNRKHLRDLIHQLIGGGFLT